MSECTHGEKALCGPCIRCGAPVCCEWCCQLDERDRKIAALQAENAKQSEWAAIQEDVINHLKAENAEQEAELVKLRKVAVKTLWYFDQANTDCDSVEVLEALEDAGYTYPDENERAALRAAGKME